MRRFGWSSIVVRQAAISTLVMLAAIGLIAMAARIMVDRQQRAALLTTIDTDIAGLVDAMERGGPAEAARRIADRTALATAADAGYRLTGPDGAMVAGNLRRPVALDPARSESGVAVTDAGDALARATRLRGGYDLVVTRPLRPAEAVLRRLTALFAIAALPAALASLLTGALLARRFGMGVAALNDAFGRFEGGDRSARTEAPRRDDELGRLAGHVDTHLARTEQLFRAQREISDNIAHELRTPLGHLDARLLRAIARTTDDTVEEDLHEAREDIRSIVSLFDALLDLALTEAGAGGAGATLFDLSERLGDLIELYGPSAEEAGLEFTALIAPGVTMRGEPMAMTRAVANLLDNAFKFTAPGSHVRLTVAPGPRIAVEDDGPGIPLDRRDSLFQRFRGVHDRPRGHGLGLALVKVIALRHGLVPRFEDAAPGARFILDPGAT